MARMMVSTRMTASERRTAVLAAAITEFARSGYAGTSTDAIATRAGISQPYLFRLFGTKKDLFIATYELVSDRIIAAMTRAGTGLEGEEAMEAMGEAYAELMQDPELLQVAAARLRRRSGRPGHRRHLPAHVRGAVAPRPRAHRHLRRGDPRVLLHGDDDERHVRHRPAVRRRPLGPELLPDAREGRRHPGGQPSHQGPARRRAGHDRGGIRMNQPAVPLFLTRRVSDHSQLSEWRRPAPAGIRRRRRPCGARCTGGRRPAAAGTGPAARPGRPGRPDRADRGGRRTGSTADASAVARAVWAVVITGLALFMASLDNLVVSTALPVIRVHLHAGLSGLEWTVNAYTLTFAVLLLSAAALGERFGRRRIFVTGIALFTASSAAAALAPSIGVLVAARALQGAGGAMIMPLSLTLLSAAVRPERRNAALGIWGAIGGTAVAIGPLVGGAVTSGWAWQYIFWLNVPGRGGPAAAGPVAPGRVAGRGRPARPGRGRAGQRRPVRGRPRPGPGQRPRLDVGTSVLASFAVGTLSLAAFVAWELRTDHPMLDIRLFAHRGFAAVNVTAMLFSFGMFGSIFFLTQFLQTVQGYSPLAAGIRVLPWTAMTMVLAPVVGQLAERWGGKPLVVTGLALQATGLAWLAADPHPDHPLRRHGGAVRAVRRRDDAVLRAPGLGGPRHRADKRSRAWPRGPTPPSASWAVCSGIAVLGAVFSSHGRLRLGPGLRRRDWSRPWPCGAGVVAVGASCALLSRPAVGAPRRRTRQRAVPGARGRVGRRWLASDARTAGRRAGAGHVEPGRCRSARTVSVAGHERATGPGPRARMSVAWGRSSASGRFRWTRTPRSTWAMVSTPKWDGHVDQEGELDRVAVGQARTSRRPTGGRPSRRPAAGAIDGQRREQEVDDRTGHELGHPAAPVRAHRGAGAGRSP